jgi:hypothetical protein
MVTRFSAMSPLTLVSSDRMCVEIVPLFWAARLDVPLTRARVQVSYAQRRPGEIFPAADRNGAVPTFPVRG